MRSILSSIVFGAGYLLRVLGGVALFCIFIYGIYVFFAESWQLGLMLIGGVVVGGWILNFIAGLLIVLAGSIMFFGVRDE